MLRLKCFTLIWLGSFDAWIRTTDSYAGNDLLYLNHRGVIPDAAVIKKGERRSNPFREKRRFDSTGFPRSADPTSDVRNEDGEEGGYEDMSNNGDLADIEG